MPRLYPWGRWHESWCAVFRGKPCDCDDSSDRPRPRKRPPLIGGSAITPTSQETGARTGGCVVSDDGITSTRPKPFNTDAQSGGLVVPRPGRA
jgi:hypothetical protein